MRSLRRHPLIALLCVLCLLGAQQAANAHFIGHLGTAAEASAFHKGGADDASALDSVCATCAAFAALSSSPPSYAAPFVALRVGSPRPASSHPFLTPAPAAPPYASRAPPAVL